MKRIGTILLVALGVVAACLAAWGIGHRALPAAPVALAKSSYASGDSASADTPFPRGNCFTGSILQKRARRDEAQLLAAHADVARRDGDSLLIAFPGRPQIRLNDDVPKCNSSILSDVSPLRDAHTGKISLGLVVTQHFGEFDNQSLYTSDGRPLNGWMISPAPGGTHIAILSNTGIRLVDWPDLDHGVRLTPRCKNWEWQDDNHFTAVCIGSQLGFIATGWRDVDGTWRMKGAAQRGETKKRAWTVFTTRPVTAGTDASFG